MTKRFIISALTLSLISTPLFGQAQQVAASSDKQDANAVIPKAFYHKKGFVISPYKPYNVLNVKHLKAGNAAYDPTTAKIDPKTGKADMSTAKIFIVPEPKKVQPASSSSTSQ